MNNPCFSRGVRIVMALVLAGCLSGCPAQMNSASSSSDNTDSAAPAHQHIHDQAHEGPHGGQVIELGRSHQYHAEIVDSAPDQSVSVYILDGELQELAIDPSPVTLSLTIDGQVRSFELASATDGKEKTSRFTTADRELFQALHEHGASGKIRVSIDGAPYVGVWQQHHHH